MSAEKKLKELEKVLLGLDGQFKAAIGAAYREGWQDGTDDFRDGCNVDEAWDLSDSKEAIDNPL